MSEWVYDDGVRAAAGLQGKAGDCVARAIAIATGLPYTQIAADLARGNAAQRTVRHKRIGGRLVERRFSRAAQRAIGALTADEGINTNRLWFKRYMEGLGFRWTPTMHVGKGCKVHLVAEELPAGRLVASVSRHYVAVIDGVIRDLTDPSRGGTRCVYGYWALD